MIHVLEHVAAAVDPRPLAIPHRKHAVVPGGTDQIDLLRAPHGGRGQVFIHARHELDMTCLQELVGFPQRLVEAA